VLYPSELQGHIELKKSRFILNIILCFCQQAILVCVVILRYCQLKVKSELFLLDLKVKSGLIFNDLKNKSKLFY
jgi:hypothetical protein